MARAEAIKATLPRGGRGSDARNAGDIATAQREGPGAGAVKQGVSSGGGGGGQATLDSVRNRKGFGGAVRADDTALLRLLGTWRAASDLTVYSMLLP